MPEVTREQREAWRREAGLGICTDGRREFGRDYRILDLLDALEAAEQERDRLDAHLHASGGVIDELTEEQFARQRAETALRDMEIERNMLRATTRGLTETLRKVEALAEELATERPSSSAWRGAYRNVAERLRAVLAAETEATSGEAGR